MVNTIILLTLTAIIGALSWKSLNNPGTHGFFRFFAFESILTIILLNTGTWFQNPFGARQILSWLCLLTSFLLALHGFYLLRMIGKPQGKIEGTTVLVTRGAYRYIRHPLYSSLLWLAVGAFLKQPSLASTALLVATVAFLLATARVEEAENLQLFGQDYAIYMENTRMFVPFLF